MKKIYSIILGIICHNLRKLNPSGNVVKLYVVKCRCHKISSRQKSHLNTMIYLTRLAVIMCAVQVRQVRLREGAHRLRSYIQSKNHSSREGPFQKLLSFTSSLFL